MPAPALPQERSALCSFRTETEFVTETRQGADAGITRATKYSGPRNSTEGSNTKVTEQDRQWRANDWWRPGDDKPSWLDRNPGAMQRKGRCNCNRGGIEGNSLLVALVTLRAVHKAIRCAIGFGAQMLITAGIENPDRGVLLRSQLHHACARRRRGVVRKEHRRENNQQVAYSSRFHFIDTSACAGCLRNENPSPTVAAILAGTPLCPLIQINWQAP